VVSYSGDTLVVRPDGETETMRITVRPAIKMLEQVSKSLSDVRVGDFIGATLARNSMGVLTAQELHIFPKAMQGTGEGLYPATPGSPSMILGGTVGQMNAGRIGVKFRGATGEGATGGATNNAALCSGRAPASPLGGCHGSVIISVPDKTPVMALVDADKSHVKAGAVLALSIISGPDGRPATPGFTIQSLATPPVAMGEVSASGEPVPAPKAAKSTAKPVFGNVAR
jgi:hypothetical protein